VLDNIGTVPSLLHWPKAKIEKRSLELLSSVGLERKLAHRYPPQLSGGQQQRVGVARALAADPLVLLMDEPFSAVDPVVRSELHEFFLGLQRELSKTIILITHDIDEAIKLGDQVAIMRVGGHLAQVGTPQHLLDEPADAFVEGFVGRDRGFRSLSFQSASELKLDRVRVVRDVETATGTGPILVVDGDARPVGWADPERAGRVFALGSTFNPETDTLRTALDSALTSPYGLAVAVTGETHRYAGVVNADDILDKVKDVRVSIAESISIREAEAAHAYEALAEPEDGYQPEDGYEPVGEPGEAYEPEAGYEPVGEPGEAYEPEAGYEPVGEPGQAYEPEAGYEPVGEPGQAYEPEDGYEPVGEPEEAYEPEQVLDQPAESQQAYASEVYDQLAEPEPVGDTDSGEARLVDQQGDVSAPPEWDVQRTQDIPSFVSMDYPEDGDVESPRDGALPNEDHRIPDEEDEGRRANGEATHRRGSSVLQ
jgi:osmoprotectant transport system ATP-binding protein